MSKVAIQGDPSGSGTFTIASPNSNSNFTLTLPAESGTALTTGTTTGISASALSTGTIPRARMFAGAVLQVVSANKTDTFSTTSTSYTDVTGLGATITPSSASSTILVFVSLQYALSGSGGAMRLTRNGTAIGGGTAAGSRPSALGHTSGENNGNWNDASVSSAKYVLDSPSSTSALTYQVQVYTTGGTRFINRTNQDADSTNGARTSSQIILMEIAG